MKITLSTRTILGGTEATKDKIYNYVVITLPKELLEACNLRPQDRISKRVEGNKVYLSYTPDIKEGNLYKTGNIGINEDRFKHPLRITDQSVEVDYQIQGSELVVEIPEELFAIPRGFNLMETIRRGFGAVA